MWIINDFLAYGMLCGWMTQKIGVPNLYGGYESIHFEVYGNSSWFDYHRRFLDPNHPYRCNRYGFRKNTIENDEAPTRLNSHQIWEKVRHLPKITETGKFVRLLGMG